MRRFHVLFLPLFVSCLALARGNGVQACADASALLPFVTKQIKQGMSLVVFQGTAAPQYACVAAGWSAHTQALEVDVKSADSVAELMRLAAPCPSQPHAFPCAAGINTSSVLVFAENAMLDSEVAQASAGALRALPHGLFAALVSRDTFARNVGGTRGDGADESGATDDSAAYHFHNQNLFSNPDLRLEPLIWPTVLANSAQHAAWLAQAAVDAWLSIVPFPYILHAHAVVDARSSFSFSPNASDAIGANGRQCTLASIHLDHAQYYLKTRQHDKFVTGAWFCIDLSSVCLFSALNLRLKHPARDRIAASFDDIYWKLHQLDRVPLPLMAGCDECSCRRRTACHVTHALRSYAATDGKRLVDLYGHLPGYWMHPGLVVATLEKNVTKWSGQPTDQLVKVRGILTTKKLKAGKTIARIPKVGGLFSPEQLPQSAAWPALKFMQDQRAELNMIYTVGLAYEMMNSANSPWKPLICNFPSGYDNFLQMQSLEELKRATAEVGAVNPGWNATLSVELEIRKTALNLHGIAAAVVALFPAIFPTGLPAKYFMHARMAVVSRAWGSDGRSVLCPIADLFNHQEPTHVGISIRKGAAHTGDSNLSIVEVVLERTVAKGDEVFNAYSRTTCIPRFVLNFGETPFITIEVCGCSSPAGYAPLEAQNNSCPDRY